MLKDKPYTATQIALDWEEFKNRPKSESMKKLGKFCDDLIQSYIDAAMKK